MVMLWFQVEKALKARQKPRLENLEESLTLLKPSHPRVLIDATSIPPSFGGVGRYILGILEGLRELDISAEVLVNSRTGPEIAEKMKGHYYITLPKILSFRFTRMIFEQTFLPRMVSKREIDILFSPHYSFPLLGKFNRVVTLHDAIFVKEAKLYSPLKRRYLIFWSRQARKHAEGLVYPSEATRNDFSSLSATLATEVVAHHGVNTKTFHPSSQDEIKSVTTRNGLRQNEYCLFVGTIEPRKNLESLLRAIASWNQHSSERLELVIAGSQGWDHDIVSLAAALREYVSVRFLGYVPIEDLSGLISGAKFFAYPSLGEGFGLPVLEAMACGAAVLTTRQPALPEVGGDSVYYCETSQESIELAIGKMLASPQKMEEIRRRAINRAKKFSWSAAAKAHMLLFDSVTLLHPENDS